MIALALYGLQAVSQYSVEEEKFKTYTAQVQQLSRPQLTHRAQYTCIDHIHEGAHEPSTILALLPSLKSRLHDTPIWIESRLNLDCCVI